MIEEKGVREKKHFGISKSVLMLVLGVLGGIFITFLIFPEFSFKDLGGLSEGPDVTICGDGSFNGSCSLDRPYYCNGSELVADSSLCGCPEFMKKSEDECVSDYETGSREVVFDYIVDGERKNLSIELYEGVAEYLNQKEKTLFYSEGEKVSRRDFKLSVIENEIQRQYTLPLVKKIQNLAPEDKVEQARIAISLVQNIEYEKSEEIVDSQGGEEIAYSRFPYEVLYENKGICGEKVELMSLLLKELGYGVSFFYYPVENHEALGIKCPVEESFKGTGYCFVETTMPAIISDSELEYKNIGELSDNFEVYSISEGMSLPEDIYEYGDAEDLQKMKNSDFFRKNKYESLKEKYGLDGEYRVD